MGGVLRPGRTLTVCTADVHAVQNGRSTLVAVMQATMIVAVEAA
jgi:acyl-coenzyme A thioesterase PaaI-like protein